MDADQEYEMAVHVAAAFSHVKEALAWGNDHVTSLRLRDAEYALRRSWGDISAENRRLVDLSSYSRAGELLHP